MLSLHSLLGMCEESSSGKVRVPHELQYTSCVVCVSHYFSICFVYSSSISMLDIILQATGTYIFLFVINKVYLISSYLICTNGILKYKCRASCVSLPQVEVFPLSVCVLVRDDAVVTLLLLPAGKLYPVGGLTWKCNVVFCQHSSC